jgi:hypothetical protein
MYPWIFTLNYVTDLVFYKIGAVILMMQRGFSRKRSRNVIVMKANGEHSDLLSKKS